jgi:hypothetical protein
MEMEKFKKQSPPDVVESIKQLADIVNTKIQSPADIRKNKKPSYADTLKNKRQSEADVQTTEKQSEANVLRIIKQLAADTLAKNLLCADVLKNMPPSYVAVKKTVRKNIDDLYDDGRGSL